MKDSLQFLDGVKREFAKVIWPTKVELIGSTLVVLGLVAAFSVYLGIVDYGLAKAIERILSF